MAKRGRITVFGTAAVPVPSTRAEVNVSVEVVRPIPAEAFEEAARRVSAVLSEIAGSGVPDNAVRTLDLQLGPRTTYQDGSEVLLGYACTQRLVARVEDTELIPELLTRLVNAESAGIRLDGISFSPADPQQALAEARRVAVDDGRRKADDYARLVGRELGAVIKVSELASGSGPNPMPKLQRLAAAAMPVAPGESELTLTLRLDFELR